MKTSAKVGALGALGIILSASGYEVYSRNVENQKDEIACVTVHSRDAVIAVEKGLLNKSYTEMFGKNRITLGSLLFHNESVAKNGTRIIVPFTLASHRGQSEFQAVVRCSNLQDIEYDKL